MKEIVQALVGAVVGVVQHHKTSKMQKELAQLDAALKGAELIVRVIEAKQKRDKVSPHTFEDTEQEKTEELAPQVSE